MRTIMKLVCVKAILFLMTTGVAAQTSNNNFAFGYFLTQDGSLGFVEVLRTQDPTTHVIETDLYYSFCGYPYLTNPCQQGTGVIPNSAFSGQVYSEMNRLDVLTLSVDTSTIAGFRNSLCFNQDFFGQNCGSSVPGPGGLFSLTWKRNKDGANIGSTNVSNYRSGKLIDSSSSLYSVFTTSQAGTVFGLAAGNVGGAEMANSTYSQTLKEKFAARKNSH